ADVTNDTGCNTLLFITVSVTGGDYALSLHDALAISRLNFINGVLGGSGTLTITGLMTWTGGSMIDSGTTAIAPGATLAIINFGNILSRPFNNVGTVTLNGTGFFSCGTVPYNVNNSG